MTRKVIHVALNGVTGRMGYRQHLVRSLLAIRDQGGIALGDDTVLYPEPVLVGRSAERLRAIAERHGLSRWTTHLDEVLGDPGIAVYFDTQVTSAREDALRRAIAAGKHVYMEKPVAASAAAAFALAAAARAARVTHGVVQDKLFLPGMIKLRRLVRDGFFGRVLSVRVEFGGFKAQWELFLRSAARGEPFGWDPFAGARGVQLAELAMRSSEEGRRVEIPPPTAMVGAAAAPAGTANAPAGATQVSLVPGSAARVTPVPGSPA